MVRERVALVGNSHILTLFEGYQSIAEQLPSDLEVTFVAQGQNRIGCAVASGKGVKRFAPAGGLLELMGELDATDIFVMWLGSQMNIRGLLQLSRSFDVVLPEDGGRTVDPGVELIPCAVVESVVLKSLSSDAQLAGLIERGQRGGATVWLMAPPPPLPADAVRERLGNESHFAARLNEIGVSPAEVDLVPPAVRVRLRTILLGAYARYAAAHGCGFCPPPEQVADGAGLLRRSCWGEDITHAGPAYGAAYLEALLGVAGVRVA